MKIFRKFFKKKEVGSVSKSNLKAYAPTTTSKPTSDATSDILNPINPLSPISIWNSGDTYHSGNGYYDSIKDSYCSPNHSIESYSHSHSSCSSSYDSSSSYSSDSSSSSSWGD